MFHQKKILYVYASNPVMPIYIILFINLSMIFFGRHQFVNGYFICQFFFKVLLASFFKKKKVLPLPSTDSNLDSERVFSLIYYLYFDFVWRQLKVKFARTY